MLKTRVTRQGEYTKMPAWLAEQASRKNCEVCQRIYGMIDSDLIETRQIVDHIFAVRFLLENKLYPLNPHIVINVISCCTRCHARKLIHESRLFAGDVLGFLRGLHTIGYPMGRVDEAAAHYGFKLPPLQA